VLWLINTEMQGIPWFAEIANNTAIYAGFVGIVKNATGAESHSLVTQIDSTG